MAKKIHNLGYRIWNQMRLAMHVDSYLQIYDEISRYRDRENWSNDVQDVMSTIVQPLLQSMIVHLDMIKSKQGISLYSLITEAFDSGHIDELLKEDLEREIDQHKNVLIKISRQRNNIIAHRSESITFAEVKEKYPISTEELMTLSKSYFYVATQLNAKLPFQNPWELRNLRAGTKTVLEKVGK
jgi:hypothetical protein